MKFFVLTKYNYFKRPSPKPTSTDTNTTSKSPDQNEKPPAPPPSPTSTKDDENKEQISSGPVEQRLTNLKAKFEESQRKAEHVREDIRGYALERFINYIKNYERVLEKKFPGAMRVYRVFMDGVKLFGRDMMDYVKIRSRMLISDAGVETLTRRELELFYQMPNDIRKVGPILLISAIPFAHYVTMPIA